MTYTVTYKVLTAENGFLPAPLRGEWVSGLQKGNKKQPPPTTGRGVYNVLNMVRFIERRVRLCPVYSFGMIRSSFSL